MFILFARSCASTLQSLRKVACRHSPAPGCIILTLISLFFYRRRNLSVHLRCVVIDADFVCLGTWKDGKNSFAIGRFSGAGFSGRDGEFRCLVGHSLMFIFCHVFIDIPIIFVSAESFNNNHGVIGAGDSAISGMTTDHWPASCKDRDLQHSSALAPTFYRRYRTSPIQEKLFRNRIVSRSIQGRLRPRRARGGGQLDTGKPWRTLRNVWGRRHWKSLTFLM